MPHARRPDINLLDSKKLTLPSWWRSLNPRGTARFWRSVERLRLELGVHKGDQGGIASIVDKVKERYHGRHH